MPNRKFYIEYYQNNRLVCIPIRVWANEYRGIFQEYGFTNTQSDFPTTHQIANRLERRFGFVRQEANHEVILRNNQRNFNF